VALAPPTGKAAKRLGEVVGREARTVNCLLGAGPTGFRHGNDLPLPFDTIVVDEASMLDTQLARAVVSAVGPNSQLILVGDADQLPGVGPGQVLRDVWASDAVPAIHFQMVFRQTAQSHIMTNAHRIRVGEVPVLAEPSALIADGGRLCVRPRRHGGSHGACDPLGRRLFAPFSAGRPCRGADVRATYPYRT